MSAPQMPQASTRTRPSSSPIFGRANSSSSRRRSSMSTDARTFSAISVARAVEELRRFGGERVDPAVDYERPLEARERPVDLVDVLPAANRCAVGAQPTGDLIEVGSRELRDVERDA